MKQRPRIYYTETDKALTWDRGQEGESPNLITRHFDRGHSAIQDIGFRPVDPAMSCPPERARTNRIKHLYRRQENPIRINRESCLRALQWIRKTIRIWDSCRFSVHVSRHQPGLSSDLCK